MFGAAIAKSGSALCPWAYQRNYKLYGQLIVQRITNGTIVNATSAEILKILQKATVAEIMRNAEPQVRFKLPF